ncbi:class I SAM-dependent methyltransferase [Priestia aryabhattai]
MIISKNNQNFDTDMINLEKKNLMPQIKSSDFFEELYNHSSFQWRVPPFPLMGNDLENLVRLNLLQQSQNQRIINLESGSGVILARLLKSFPNKQVIGIENNKELIEQTTQALLEFGCNPTIQYDQPTSPKLQNNDLLITAMNIVDQEKLIKYLLETKFDGDLLAYRFHAPGPKPHKIFSNGTYDWVHYKFGADMKAVEWQNSGLAVLLGTQRYVAVHTKVHCNKDTSDLKIEVSDELKDILNVKMGRNQLISGSTTSVELSFKAVGPHKRRLQKGYVKIYDEKNNTVMSELAVVISIIPMVEPGLARWVDIEELSVQYLEKFLGNENIHVLSNWVCSGMHPPYDYY